MTHHLKATLLPHGDAPVDLWIRDGRITYVAQPTAESLAETGGFLAAGLVDSHTHLSFVAKEDAPRGRAVIDAQRRLHRDAGTLLLRDLGATDEAILQRVVDDLPRVQAAGHCLLIEPRFPFFVTSARALPGAAAAQAEAGAQWVKIFADWPGWEGQHEPNFSGTDALSYPTETLRAAVDAAHERGARVAAHAFGREAAEVVIEAGVDSIEHGWGLDAQLLSKMAKRGIAWTPMLAIAAPMLRHAEGQNDAAQSAWIRASLVSMRTLLPQARALGVTVLAGTDWFPSVTLTDEICALHQYGLTAVQALDAATSSARAFLRASDLEEGAPADLVLFRQDPREELRRLAKPERIVLGGRVMG